MRTNANIGVSVIIPALNEEAHLEDAFRSVQNAAEAAGVDPEIVIINDGSRDETPSIANRLARESKRVRVIHHSRNRGFGASYRSGLKEASEDLVLMIPGDNEILQSSIKNILAVAGEADLIIPYTSNTEVRNPIRRIVSGVFTSAMNFFFGLKLQYYNGPCLLPRSAVMRMRGISPGFAYMAQILVRLIVIKKMTYREVPMRIATPKKRKTKAFAMKNVLNVIFAVTSLWWEVQLKRFSWKKRK